MLMDAGEYTLHIFTLAGPLVLLVYAVWHVLTVQSWNAVLFIVVAIVLLVVNVIMRLPAASGPGGDRPGAG